MHVSQLGGDTSTCGRNRKRVSGSWSKGKAAKMIADTAVVTTSPWAGDQMLFPKEYYKMSSNSDLHTIDMDIAALEAEIEKVTRGTEQGDVRPTTSGLINTSCGTSIAGSECSDDMGLDIESDAEHLFPVSEDQEYLTTNLWNLLGHPVTDANMSFSESLMTDPWDMTDMASLTSLDQGSQLPSDHTDLSQYDSIPSVSAPSSPQPQRKKHKHRSSANADTNQLTTSKSWSSMSNTQQVSVIEDLTKIISNEMGLREQMEVIRIINPEASISSTDTEFVIDLDCLSDEKLQKVRALVKQHTSSSASSVAGSSSGVSDCSSECSSPSQKKQTKRSQKNRPREHRQRQRKEYRQMMKERRSGLFQKEEVLALSVANGGEEEDGDIDIL